MCVDSRAINNIIIKYSFLIPRLDDMLNEFKRSRVFSRINLSDGYHQIKMNEDAEWKIAFKTKNVLNE